MNNQIFITMEGGLIQNIRVTKDLEKTKITVIDWDTEGTPDEDLTEIFEDKACIFRFDTTVITTKEEAILKNAL